MSFDVTSVGSAEGIWEEEGVVGVGMRSAVRSGEGAPKFFEAIFTFPPAGGSLATRGVSGERREYRKLDRPLKVEGHAEFDLDVKWGDSKGPQFEAQVKGGVSEGKSSIDLRVSRDAEGNVRTGVHGNTDFGTQKEGGKSSK